METFKNHHPRGKKATPIFRGNLPHWRHNLFLQGPPEGTTSEKGSLKDKPGALSLKKIPRRTLYSQGGGTKMGPSPNKNVWTTTVQKNSSKTPRGLLKGGGTTNPPRGCRDAPPKRP